jgi:hypothetical protein
MIQKGILIAALGRAPTILIATSEFIAEFSDRQFDGQEIV